MDPERWQRVKAILDDALELVPPARPAFLEQACGGDAALRQEVESFLDLDHETSDFIEKPAFPMRPESSETLADGSRIGHYRVRRLLARGGMGSVYLAVRADDFEKQVALKLIKRGMDSEEIVRRFRNERQILANLDHPNIARILDGGTTDDALPYFVMEYVEGEPIDQYCDARKLSTRARLELFRKVCAALHFAHQNLVIHRDLKPGNILITADGVPKLLDFGIAKLLSSESTHQTRAPDSRPMTLKYASPEQARDQPVTTASDVYSLGVLLYQLLTGSLPCDLDRCGLWESLRVIREEEPAKPSLAVRRRESIRSADGTDGELTPESVSRTRDGELRKLRRRLSGDVDSIALMAMRKEPQRRYGSVEQFSEDIRRHLEGQPVIARKATLPYRAAKFARRHKWRLAAAAAVLVLGCGFTISTIFQLERTVRERDRANRMSAFLVELLEAFRPSTPEQVTSRIKPTLDKGTEIVDQAFGEHPLEQAVLRDSLGVAYFSLGFYDDAKPQFENALEIRRRTLGDDHDLVVESMNNLAVLLWQMDDYQRAEVLMRQALEILYQYYPEDSPELLEEKNNLAILLQRRGVYDEAETLFREVLATRRTEHGDEHPEVIPTLNNLAAVLTSQGDYAAAEEIYRQGLAIRLRLYAPEHKDVAASLNSLGTVLYLKGDLGEAETCFRKALAIRRKVYGPEHPYVARVLNNLGMVLHVQGVLQQAEELYLASLAIQRKKLGEGHTEVAVTKRNIASLLAARSDPAAAMPQIDEALESFRESLPQGHWRIADAESVRGTCLAALGRYQEAEPLLVESYSIIRRVKGEHAPHTRDAASRVVALYEAWGRPEKAARFRVSAKMRPQKER